MNNQSGLLYLPTYLLHFSLKIPFDGADGADGVDDVDGVVSINPAQEQSIKTIKERTIHLIFLLLSIILKETLEILLNL